MLRIIKIQVHKNGNEVYTFTEFNEKIQSDAIYCFKRSKDSSKFV
jgi:hypothetical protein